MAQAIREDGGDALGELLIRFRGPIENAVGKFLRKFQMESHTDDLVSEVFLQTLIGFRRYDPQGHDTIWPWLRRVSANVCLKWAKRNQVGIKSDGLWCNELDDTGEPTEDNQFDDTTATLWASDVVAEPVKPPPQPADDPAVRWKAKPLHTRPIGGSRPKPVPPHVQRSRQQYAQM
jgi:DNA-directed RNA polymerase specialized sigma24 family protein